MTYSGAVKVGGPADVHELRDLMISKVAVGPMDNNAYLLRCRATDEQLLIDAASDAGTLLTLIGDDGIASVVTTHRHGDHWQALAEVVADRRVVCPDEVFLGATGAAGMAQRLEVLLGTPGDAGIGQRMADQRAAAAGRGANEV
jgi:glyoxylase-like metal-dependent hydrolase (beta-lactamase superfamily II)